MDTVIYTVNIKESATSALQTFSSLLFGCFTNNLMNAESDKKHLIRSCTEANTAIINGLSISLGTTIDQKLKFDDHVNYLCEKAVQKN